MDFRGKLQTPRLSGRSTSKDSLIAVNESSRSIRILTIYTLSRCRYLFHSFLVLVLSRPLDHCARTFRLLKLPPSRTWTFVAGMPSEVAKPLARADLNKPGERLSVQNCFSTLKYTKMHLSVPTLKKLVDNTHLNTQVQRTF